jgi:hypothetical protein
MLIRPWFAAHPHRASAAVHQGLRYSGHGASAPVLARTPLGSARARAVTGRYPESSCRWLITSRNRIVVRGPTWRSSSSAGSPSFNVSHHLERRVGKGMRNFSARPRKSVVWPLTRIGSRREPSPGTQRCWEDGRGFPNLAPSRPKARSTLTLTWSSVTFTCEAFHTRKASILSDRSLEGRQRRP